MWLPLGAHAAINKNKNKNTANTTNAASAGPTFDARETHDFGVLGRLRTGISIETASAALATVASRRERAFPAINTGYTLAISAPTRLMFMPGPGSTTMTATLAVMLMVMPMIVLLVACLNLADLLLARGHVRRQELAIRSSSCSMFSTE